MLIASNERGAPVLQEDGDAEFLRVDTRQSSHQLKPGTCADATNCRFAGDGRVTPRWSSIFQPWGGITIIGASLIAPGTTYPPPPSRGVYVRITLSGLTIGNTYQYTPGNAAAMSTGIEIDGSEFGQPAGTLLAGGFFTATATTYYVWSQQYNMAVTTHVQQVQIIGGNPCGYYRFNSPENFDVGVLLTDDWRNQAGEDGGRGRAWKIQSGNVPEQIPMNGNDIYGQTVLVECFSALVMLRQDAERHYFAAAAVASNTIQLNCAPTWNDGDAVLLWGDTSVSSAITGTHPPVIGQQYFVKATGTNAVELYFDSGLTQQALFTGAMGQFYLERQAANPGFFGNGAPP